MFDKELPIESKNFLSEFVEQSNQYYLLSLNGESQKEIGQIFTPLPIARFMAGLFKIEKAEISILDPGAGTGILTAALCDRIIENKLIQKITCDLYENDKKVLPHLKKNLEVIKEIFSEKKIDFNFNIIDEDFITTNSDHFNSDSMFYNSFEKRSYDLIISNPPYYKLAKSHPHSIRMKKVVYGQPNVYFFFMTLAAALLKDDGQMVFITPRSYCSGLYFKKFRTWFLKRIKPEYFHIFESRKETFNNEILQETIILKGTKKKNIPRSIRISTSFNSNLTDSDFLKVNYEDIIQPDDPEQIIHLPVSITDIEILEIVRSWKQKFTDLGYRISTGPVVHFRATEFLNEDYQFDGQKKVPLLWMNHLKNYRIKFPNSSLKKPQTISVKPSSVKLLLKNNNYVLVKRFSSKEQKKRISAAIYSRDDFNVDYIGIENHLNYIWKPFGELSTIESLGIMAILNSSIIDKFFRIINGNTQVNATEINNLPFPTHENILEIGKQIKELKSFNESLINQLVHEQLGISLKLTEN